MNTWTLASRHYLTLQRTIIVLLMILLTAATVTASREKSDFTCSLDMEEDLKIFSPIRNAEITSEKSLSGGKCLKLDTSLGPNTAVAILKLPNEPTQGVLTFWLYSAIGEPETLDGLYFSVVCKAPTPEEQKTATSKSPKPPKSSTSQIELGYRYQHDQWMILRGNAGHPIIATGIKCDSGWTRFDIVNPAGDEPQNFIVYINGKEAYRTPEKLLSFSYVVFGSYDANQMFLDEISFNSDPNSFRPNVIKTIEGLGNKDNNLSLKPNETLDLKIELNPKGTKEKHGELTLSLINGIEKTLEKKTVDVKWSDLKDNKIPISLPAPKRSGYYWIEAAYKENGMPLADVDRQRVDIQFLTPGYERDDHPVIHLTGDWDFLPVVENYSKEKIPPKSIEVPKAPPKDWSESRKLQGPWYQAYICHRFRYCNAAWYHRELTIPSSFTDKRIFLDIDNPSTAAYIFVDGVNTGLLVEAPGATVDLSKWLKANQTFDLDLFVVASPNLGYAWPPYHGPARRLDELYGENFKPAWFKQSRGLCGPVTVQGVPRNAYIDGVAIRTFVKAKKLSVVFELADLTPGKEYTIDSVVSAAGKIVKQLPSKTFIAKTKSQSVTIDTSWKKPTLWTMGSPYLYDLNAKLLGENSKILDVMRPERFGFREITSENRRLCVNGVPVTLFSNLGATTKQDLEYGFVSDFLKYGFNFLQKPAGKGHYYRSRNHRAFDEAGIAQRIQQGGIVGVGHPLGKWGKPNDPEFWRQMEEKMKYVIRKYRNHPSIFFWYGSQGVDSGMQYNPKLMDGDWRKVLANKTQRDSQIVSQRCVDLIHRLDPTRLVDTIDDMNDTINVTYYSGFNPIQEEIEHNEYWNEYGEKPFFIEEHAAPFQQDWFCAAGHSHHNGDIPFIAENCAMTLGDKAFVRDSVDNEALSVFEKYALGGLKKASEIEDPEKRSKAIEEWRRTFVGGKQALAIYSLYPQNKRNTVWGNRLREQILNWRADGIGSFCGGFNAIGPSLYTILRDAQKTVVAFLAGTPDKRTAKDHIFAPGETLVRSALILNNRYEPINVQCDWELILDGKTVAKEKKNVTIPNGEQLSIPIRAKIPAGNDREGLLRMTLLSDSGDKICEDQCEIDIIAPQAFTPKETIALIDPLGDSARTMKKMGIPFRRLNFATNFNRYKTIVFGRDAFKYEEATVPGGIDLGGLTRMGKNVVILEQSEDILRKRFKFRTAYISPRNAFIRTFDHPLFDGLSNRVLNYWRGASTLTHGYLECLAQLNPRSGWRNGAWRDIEGNDGTIHKHHTKWGNTHNVATVVIIKPDTGNFRTLVDCGFALNYAATLELENAKGRIIFNQIDVTNRTKVEPAAERFLKNLLRYAETAPTPKWKKALYMGVPEPGQAKGGYAADNQEQQTTLKYKELLTSLRLDFTKIETPKVANPAGHVLILGDATPEALQKWKSDLETFVKAGGIVFSLPKDEKQLNAPWLPFSIETQREKINQSIVDRQQPLLKGLGNSDFFWKGNIDVLAIKKLSKPGFIMDSGIIAQAPYNKGQYVFCQIAPSLLDVDKNPWLKITRRYNERALVGLLNNLHVQMASPKFLDPLDAPYKLIETVDLSGKWSICPSDESTSTCPSSNDKRWLPLTLPGSFQKQLPQLSKDTGWLWLRRSFELKKSSPEDTLVKLSIGRISGSNWVFLNGAKVAETTLATDPNFVGSSFREYEIPANKFLAGANDIAIRVFFSINGGLGLANTNGSVGAPMLLECFQPNDSNGLSSQLPSINLVGIWQGIATKEKIQCPTLNDKRWHNVRVPGHYDSFDAKGYPEEWKGHHGYFWYKKAFRLDQAIPADAEPFLLIGGVDDEDTTYLNGKFIGHTGKDNQTEPGWCGAFLRKYPIPREYFKKGINIITLLDYDPINNGGIWKPPVEIIFHDPDKLKDRKLKETPYIHLLTAKDDPYRAAHY